MQSSDFYPKGCQPSSEPVISIEVFTQRDLAEQVKQVIFSICGEQTNIVTCEGGMDNAQILFTVPAALADKVTVKIILALPNNSLYGLNKRH